MPLVVHTLNKTKMRYTQTYGSSIATTFLDNIFCRPQRATRFGFDIEPSSGIDTDLLKM